MMLLCSLTTQTTRNDISATSNAAEMDHHEVAASMFPYKEAVINHFWHSSTALWILSNGRNTHSPVTEP